jgi:low affinity Fe/Cu permease
MIRFHRAQSRIGRSFEQASQHVTHWTGTSWAFTIACLLIIAWLVTGPVFGYSDTWQMVINTCTTIITFLMVFLIQRTQNKESLAINLKLNEIIASTVGASNRLVDIEELSEEELDVLHEYYSSLAEAVKRETDIRQSHSIDDGKNPHLRVAKGRKPAKRSAVTSAR